MATARIPNSVAVVVGEALGAFYYNHGKLENLFHENGAPGEPPLGNCEDKCINWLKRASADPEVDALAILGGVLAKFMETNRAPYHYGEERLENDRRRIRTALAKHGLSYHDGGQVIGTGTAAPTRSLEATLRARDLQALQVEFDRALSSVERDPGAAVTAASASIESLGRVYIEDEGLPLPSDQSIKPLWKAVQGHLGLDPSRMEDDDLKRVLSGLISIVDGLGAFRTHVGSAHGRGRTSYRPLPRHARLAIHSAHTVAVFVLETWDHRRQRDSGRN
jgi:hypothetical protein